MKVLDATTASYAYGSYQYLSIIILSINLKVAMTLLRIRIAIVSKYVAHVQ